MADSARDLAGHLALMACQLHQLDRHTQGLPVPDSIRLDTYAKNGAPERLGVTCYFHGRQATDPSRTTHETQIDAIRAWALALGSDLRLSDARPVPASSAGQLRRSLETDGVLSNGLHVNAYTLLDYDPADPAYQRRAAVEPALAAA